MRSSIKNNHLNIDSPPNPPSRAVIYARISTAEQSSYSLENQKEACKKLCDYRDLKVIAMEEDDGYSGDSLDRPGIQRILAMAQRKEFDHLIIWKLDRLSRRVSDTLEILEKHLIPKGIKFLSQQEEYLNTDSPFATAVLQILSVMAQLERANILEKTGIGRLRHLELKKYLGQAAYGYEFNENSELRVVKKEAEVVLKIFRWYTEDNFTMSQIAEKLNAEFIHSPRKDTWDKASVRNTLSRKIYSGQIIIGTKNKKVPLTEYTCTPILPPGMFELAQKKTLERSRLGRRNTQRDYIFSGILFCGRCNMVLSPRVSGNEIFSYGYKRKGNERPDSERCPIKCGSIGEFKVADALVRFFSEMIRVKTEGDLEIELAKYEPEKMKEDDVKIEIDRLKEDKNNLRKKWDYWMDACAEGNCTKQKRDAELEKIRRKDEGIDDRILILQQSLLTEQERKFQLNQRKSLVKSFKSIYNNKVINFAQEPGNLDVGIDAIRFLAKCAVSSMKIESIKINWDKNSIDIIRTGFGKEWKPSDSFEMNTS